MIQVEERRGSIEHVEVGAEVHTVDEALHNETQSYEIETALKAYSQPGLELAAITLDGGTVEEGEGVRIYDRRLLSDTDEIKGDFVGYVRSTSGREMYIPFEYNAAVGVHTLEFGRSHPVDLGGQLDAGISREHASILIRQLNSTRLEMSVDEHSSNGSRVHGEFVGGPEETGDSQEEGHSTTEAKWGYTMTAEEAARLMRDVREQDRQRASAAGMEADPEGFRFSDRVAEEPYIDGYQDALKYKNRSIIGRDSKINHGVYSVPGMQEDIVVDDRPMDKDGKRVDGRVNAVYQELYDKALDVKEGPKTWQPKANRGNRNGLESNLLQSAYDTVVTEMQYDLDHSKSVAKKYTDHKYDLSNFIEDKKGVCRHQALAVGYLLERMINEGKIEGSVSVDRNQIKGVGGHAWVRYTDGSGEVSIIDPAQKFVGSLERAQKMRGKWDYRRPGEVV